jgi:multidrug efflux pump subunit AcrA (membrane-fusion protein)
MQHKLPPLPVRILVVLIVLSTIGYYAFRYLNPPDDGQLKASGTIESVTVNISSELAGKVAEVLAEEGQPVKAGDPLLRLDDSLLASQRAVAVAQLNSAMAGTQAAQNALLTAQAQHQITLEGALAQGKSTRLQDWFSDPDLFEQPGWYYTRVEQIQAAQAQVETAQKAVEDSQANLEELSQTLAQADFIEAEQRLLDARLAYLIAQTVNFRAQNSATEDVPVGRYNRTHCGTNQGYFVENARLTNQIYKCTGDEQLGDAGRTLYNNARDELEAAQQIYNELLSSDVADSVLQARADLSVAQERYYSALDFLRTLQTGDQSTSVTAAQGAVDQAQIAVDQAQRGVDQAQASLDLLDAQIAKLVVYAPMDGIILTRNVEPGEFVQPGAATFAMADLNYITITVYVPEDRYGQIKLGQQADVTVDSFPGETFAAQVIHIADQAEFTPRNVQTVEGRSSTVYAIKLNVTDSEAKLKIGMPADVTFE